MVFGSSFPTGLGRIPRTQTGSRKMAISELQISICTVLLVDQNFSYHMVSLPANKLNSLAFAEHFVISTSGLVAHHSHKFQWNAGPQKRRYSRWNSVDILSVSAKTRKLEGCHLEFVHFRYGLIVFSILTSPNGMLDPGRLSYAAEILLISCLEAEIHAIKVYQPPS